MVPLAGSKGRALGRTSGYASSGVRAGPHVKKEKRKSRSSDFATQNRNCKIMISFSVSHQSGATSVPLDRPGLCPGPTRGSASGLRQRDLSLWNPFFAARPNRRLCVKFVWEGGGFLSIENGLDRSYYSFYGSFYYCSVSVQWPLR